MASTFKSLLNSAKQTISGQSTPIPGTPSENTPIEQIFPKVDPAVDGDDCDHDCESCHVKYPKGFKIDEDDELYGHVKGWNWVRDVADEKGSVMQAIDHGSVKPSNGKLMLSASNIPTPSHSTDYSQPTTVLLLPAFIVIDNVTPQSVPTLITEFIDKAPTNMTPLGPISIPQSLPDPLPSAEQLTSRPSPHRALILLCSQKLEMQDVDKKEFERHLRPLGLFRDLDDDRLGGVGIYFISHVGGHKYSANVMIYRRSDAFGLDGVERANTDGDIMPSKVVPGEDEGKGAAQCMWLARVKPEDCEGIVKFTILQGKLIKPESQLRGGFDRQKGLFSW
ncbi:putative sucrase ferredoxin domain-containing protein [Botrytis fragariae]|uniref:Putative sucrase ferredoxin domain-containing protein n=1 Tax=Botrytis fragariae TaxID=1964551 RepID=A0A8H6B5M1_9HELO|nr:putative sucrase ferredoxin domain-containing protein [Botrytis fragariae]KAF5879397.1 putative sucrase ferredoxin domain-containing protein [Botrytis fragariae]